MRTKSRTGRSRSCHQLARGGCSGIPSSRSYGRRKPVYTVFVGKPTQWGNAYFRTKGKVTAARLFRNALAVCDLPYPENERAPRAAGPAAPLRCERAEPSHLDTHQSENWVADA